MILGDEMIFLLLLIHVMILLLHLIHVVILLLLFIQVMAILLLFPLFAVPVMGDQRDLTIEVLGVGSDGLAEQPIPTVRLLHNIERQSFVLLVDSVGLARSIDDKVILYLRFDLFELLLLVLNGTLGVYSVEKRGEVEFHHGQILFHALSLVSHDLVLLGEVELVLVQTVVSTVSRRLHHPFAKQTLDFIHWNSNSEICIIIRGVIFGKM